MTTHIVNGADRACPNCLTWDWLILERNDGHWSCDKCDPVIDARMPKLPPEIQALVDSVASNQDTKP